MEFINDIKNNIKSVLQTTDKIKWMDIEKIIIDPELEGIFVQKENEIANICENMKENGFDPAHPIILVFSKEHPELNNINADGHTRYKAAIRAGLTKVAIIYKEFANREELLKFVYEQQLLRRNLTENEIFNAWSALNRLTDENGKKAKSDTEIAEELKISRRQVAKMKEVEKKATPEVLDSIKSGELTINKAYSQIKQEEIKIKKPVAPVVESKAENQKTATKTDKLDSNTITQQEYYENYANGFKFGLQYTLTLLKIGKSPEVIYQDVLDLKQGKTTLGDLETKLKSIKESYEQNQAE